GVEGRDAGKGGGGGSLLVPVGPSPCPAARPAVRISRVAVRVFIITSPRPGSPVLAIIRSQARGAAPLIVIGRKPCRDYRDVRPEWLDFFNDPRTLRRAESPVVLLFATLRGSVWMARVPWLSSLTTSVSVPQPRTEFSTWPALVKSRRRPCLSTRLMR